MSIPLISLIKPYNDGDFPVYEDVDCLGGYQVRDEYSDLSAIPTANRKEGMLVFVKALNQFYTLVGGIEDANWQVSGFVGATGPVGPTGPIGYTGPVGHTGPSGGAAEAGATGPTGPVGSNGANGATGPTGPVGSNGANGATGPVGHTGPAGSNGSNGSNGATGPVGATGINAYLTTGSTGIVGVDPPEFSILVNSLIPMSPGQIVYMYNGSTGPISGYFDVNSVNNGPTGPIITLESAFGYPGPLSGTAFPPGSTISPSGIMGPTGPTGPQSLTYGQINIGSYTVSNTNYEVVHIVDYLSKQAVNAGQYLVLFSGTLNITTGGIYFAIFTSSSQTAVGTKVGGTEKIMNDVLSSADINLMAVVSCTAGQWIQICAHYTSGLGASLTTGNFVIIQIQ